MEWSAKRCQADQPFGSWADDLAAAFVRLEPRQLTEHPFRGAISRTDAAPIRISRVIASKHRVLRLRSHIANSDQDLCFVNLQLEGVGRYMQRGHEQVCGPGDLAFVDTTEPFEIANAWDFQLFCFAVPRHLLPAHFSDRPRLSLSATALGRALSRTLADYSELCLNAQTHSKLAELGAAHLVDLISHATGVLAEAPPTPKGSVLLSMMLDHIDRHSGDPQLSAATLARKFRCSVRYVHRVFSTTGRSVAEHVNGRRIIACTRDLLDHSHNRTIAEIAFAAGFQDISHFNRLFKRSNGATPSEFRRIRAVSRD
ncbi:helix-turn-helix domain-containing protein [Bradyrhizobium sp. HKCCYLS1011]|uniref:helix-turn-helix domain-containing protein n=1 Tax=Bradyrhizobium sp. HKCCYLS1011 TaxID=3420733 RepID=UPI003EC068F1